MSFFLLVILIFFACIDIMVLKGIRIVPQNEEWIVHRLGKPFKTLKPGLNFVIPFIDKTTQRTSTDSHSSKHNKNKTTTPSSSSPLNPFIK